VAVSGAAFGLSLLGRALGAPTAVIVMLQAVAAAAGGYNTLRRAAAASRKLQVTMDVLMTITVAGAIAIGELTEGAAVCFLLSVSEALQSRTTRGARRAIRALLDVAPRRATVRRDGEWVSRPADEVGPGDTLLVRPGERIAADGVVVNGRSSVDESPVTGESVPVEKRSGEPVFAGTINCDGAMEVRVAKSPADSTIARIVQLVREAQEQKAPVETSVDRFARYYTPTVIALAALVSVVPPLFAGRGFAESFYRGLAFLAVSCPCAIVVSTPVSVMSAVADAARNGVLVKGAVHLETLGRVRAIAFDKTGTLTYGRPVVTRVVSFGDRSEDGILSYAAGIESRSAHPIATAIVAEARKRGVGLKRTEDFRAMAGLGASASAGGKTYFLGSPGFVAESGIDIEPALGFIEETRSEGCTAVLLGVAPGWGRAGELLGGIALADEIRPEAPRAVSRLRSLGVEHVAMLTGDGCGPAIRAGEAAGVDEIIWGLRPDEKAAVVKQMECRYRDVAMAGDGVNDAPALAAAAVGIAMGAMGSDAALETADVALMSDDLSRIPYLVSLGRAMLSVVGWNVALTVGIKVLAVALISARLAGLWAAVAADMGSSVLVTLNSMRLLGAGGGPNGVEVRRR
jgi:Cd2+/Zn2+-exporting ATPase